MTIPSTNTQLSNTNRPKCQSSFTQIILLDIILNTKLVIGFKVNIDFNIEGILLNLTF